MDSTLTITNLKIKTIEFTGGINSMVKYNVNLKFKENGKSLNETIINVLKIELEKYINNLNEDLPFKNSYYSQRDESNEGE